MAAALTQLSPLLARGSSRQCVPAPRVARPRRRAVEYPSACCRDAPTRALRPLRQGEAPLNTESIDTATEFLRRYKSRHVRRIQRLVRQPSSSIEQVGVHECAALLTRMHEEVGLSECAVVDTGGIPGVWATYDAGASRTLAVYTYFDVRLAPPDESWDSPPFAAALVERSPYPQVLVGRGAHGTKGPYVAFLNAVEALIASEGTLPVNLLVLLEGSELVGSPHYRQMFAAYRDRLAQADACLWPSASQDARGRVHVGMGCKGMIYGSLECSGARWGRGPQGAPLHGMIKAVVDSPPWRLLHAMATMTGRDGNTVTIDGFEDSVPPPTEDEVQAARAYREAMGGGAWNQAIPGVASVPAPAGDLDDEAALLAYFYGPSFNLNGLSSGDTGPPAAPFTLPHAASAKFDFRVPRGVSVRRLLEQMRAHLNRRGYHDIEINVTGAFDPFVSESESRLYRALFSAIGEVGAEVVTAPATAGAGPWSLFPNELGVPMARGVGIGGGAAGPNEYLVIDGAGPVGGLIEMETSFVSFLRRFGAVDRD